MSTLERINDFLRRKDHKAALAEVKVTCAVLEKHAYKPIVKLLYQHAFQKFVDACKSKKPRLHPDFMDKLDAAKAVDIFEEHFVANAKSEGYQAFLVHCKKALCSENLLWLTCFLEMKKQVQNPERFLVLFYEGYKEFISMGAHDVINLSHDNRKEIDEQYLKCFGYLPDRQRDRKGALDNHGPPGRARAAAVAVPPRREEEEDDGEEEEQDKGVKKTKKTKKKGEKLEVEEEDGGEEVVDKGATKKKSKKKGEKEEEEQDEGAKKKTKKKGEEEEREEEREEEDEQDEGAKKKKTKKKGEEVEGEEDGMKKKKKDKVGELVAGCDDEAVELEAQEGAKKKTKKKKEEEGGRKKKVAGCDDEEVEVEEEERVKKTKKKVAAAAELAK